MPRISELDPTAFPSLEAEVAVTQAGSSFRMPLSQMRELWGFLSSEIGHEGGTVSDALAALGNSKADADTVAASLSEKATKFTAAGPFIAGRESGTGEPLALTIAQVVALLSVGGQQWSNRAIGEPFALFDNLIGVSSPPTDQFYRYIKLTASDAYNSGILTSEVVSGSAPLISATAVISLAGSPLNGETVRLVNTERRFLRPGQAGTLENSQNLAHSHSALVPEVQPWRGSNGNIFGGTPTLGAYSNTTSSGGDEARPRNIGANYYMRIL